MGIPTFSAKSNKRAAGAEILISNESHIIPAGAPYVIRLIEVPNYDPPAETVTIPGYTMTTTTPGIGQFLVDFSVGTVTFHSSAAGNGVLVTYYGLGSEVDAEDINGLQDAVTNLTSPLYLGKLTQAEEDTLVLGLGTDDGGTLWFNGDTSQFTGWNGTNKVLLG